MVLWRQTRNINLSLPEELLYYVDEAAKQQFMSRSEYIRHTLNQQRVKSPLRTPFTPPPDIWHDLDDS